MIAVIVDTVSDNELTKEIGKYRLVFFINTKERASKVYSKIKKIARGIELKVNIEDESLIEKIAVGIAREFAEYREPIHVWIGDKCIVY